MSKICLLGDLHFGRHSNSLEMLKYQEKFFDSIFFPFLKENNIKKIITLGDEYDNPKHINFNTLDLTKKFFFDRIEKECYELTMIVGNHNIFYKNTLEVNSNNLLLEKYKSINIINKPTEITFYNTKFLLVPWITKDNEQEVFEFIENTDAKYLLGHFEATDISLYGNWKYSKGIEVSKLKTFEEIYSGHYHLQLFQNNFKYLGTPYQLDWDDSLISKYFYIFDTHSKKLKEVVNPLKFYNNIYYSDDLEVNFKDYEEQYIRVYVKSLEDYKKFDSFIKKLEEVCYDVKVIEHNFKEVKESENKSNIINLDDTMSTLESIKKSCESVEGVDNLKVFSYLEELYLKTKQN